MWGGCGSVVGAPGAGWRSGAVGVEKLPGIL